MKRKNSLKDSLSKLTQEERENWKNPTYIKETELIIENFHTHTHNLNPDVFTGVLYSNLRKK